MPRKESVISKIKRDYRPNENLVAVIINCDTIIEQSVKNGVVLHPEEVDELLEILSQQTDSYNTIINRQIQILLEKRKEKMFNETQSSIPTGEE